MVIFDIRPSVTLLVAIHALCERCTVPARQQVLRRATRFTLFFVPLFPVVTNYYLNCDHCDSTTRISQDQADGYVELEENARIEHELDVEFGQAIGSLAESSRGVG